MPPIVYETFSGRNKAKRLENSTIHFKSIEETQKVITKITLNSYEIQPLLTV